MNLRKSTKKALINEIRRLRHFEKLAKERYLEIDRRDKATKMFRKIEPVAITFANVLMLCETSKETQETWEKFWQLMSQRISEGRITDFWAERAADLTDLYYHYLIDGLYRLTHHGQEHH